MRIGLITDSIDMKAPGISRYIRNLVKGLLQINQSNGHKHEFFLIHQNASKDELYNLEGVNEVIVKVPAIPFGRELRKLYLLPKKLEKYNFDIVHDLAQIGPFVFKAPYKAVETVHDLSSITHPEFHTSFTNYRTKIGLPVIKKNVDLFITVSNAVKSNLLKKLNISADRIKSIYEAADPIFSKSTFNNRIINDPYILFVSTIEPRKNISNLLDAFEIIKQYNNQIRMVIIGQLGWKSDSVLNKIKNNSSVFWKSDTSDNELVQLYNQAEIMVMPSYTEGFGLPIVEAMSCGCPVAVSDIPVFREVVKSAGLFFNQKNPENISSVIGNALSNKNILNRYSILGQERSKFFSWQKCAQETLSSYLSL